MIDFDKPTDDLYFYENAGKEDQQEKGNEVQQEEGKEDQQEDGNEDQQEEGNEVQQEEGKEDQQEEGNEDQQEDEKEGQQEEGKEDQQGNEYDSDDENSEMSISDMLEGLNDEEVNLKVFGCLPRAESDFNIVELSETLWRQYKHQKALLSARTKAKLYPDANEGSKVEFCTDVKIFSFAITHLML